MNRADRRKQDKGRIKNAKQMLRKTLSAFEPIDLSTVEYHPSWLTRAYSNTRYVVMIDDQCKTTHGPAIRAMVQKNDDIPIPNHWSEMQKIKNELFGQETTAIEYYPKESELVNEHNIYWMWIFPEGTIPLAL